MTKADLKRLASFWAKESQNDFVLARDIIVKAKRYSGGLFFLHLSIEKKLKSMFVVKFADHAPMTHNLIALAERLELKLPAKFDAALAMINQFNMSTRYPEEKSLIKKKFNQKFAHQYLKIAGELLEWLANH
jgi:HEPN domain-containing protein